MGLFNTIRMGASGAGGGYEISRSLRIDNDDKKVNKIQLKNEVIEKIKKSKPYDRVDDKRIIKL